MQTTEHPAKSLKPLLEECGYKGVRLKEDYSFGSMTVPFVGFASKPWDFDSACIAATACDGDSEEIARSYRDLGAPIVWVRRNGSVDWWIQHPDKPSLFATKPVAEFPTFVRKHRKKLDPLSVYRGKTIARVDSSKQLDFVDVGLLPLLREEAGNKLHDVVEQMVHVMLDELGGGVPDQKKIRNVFTAVFRLLAGKILKDKGVRGFKGLDVFVPFDVLNAVEKHYNSGQSIQPLKGNWATALRSATEILSSLGNFAAVSPEALAFVYEQTLVTKALRKKLGIHATPPRLVDYMVWRLYDWISEIPEDDRHVFEPACGHAPFLLSTMRLLRMDLHGRSEPEVHSYLKSHIHGLEVDDFAREIARLSLTLADIPNPNGWDLQDGDMFASDALRRTASKCRILLCNPPYEAFGNQAKRYYAKKGEPLSADTKATETLLRILPSLPEDSVFGVVVPQGVLHSREAKQLRDVLVQENEVLEVSLFADNLFEEGDAETAIIIGRRLKPKRGRTTVHYRRVREMDMDSFKERLAFSSSRVIRQDHFLSSASYDLRVPDLEEVWQYLECSSTLNDLATAGQGLAHHGRFLPEGAWTVELFRKGRGRPGFHNVPSELTIFGLPATVSINLDKSVILRPRVGATTGIPQVLVNYHPVARAPWRLKAVIDRDGHAVTSSFLAVRPRDTSIPLVYLWALLNSPLANAYVYCFLQKRNVLAGRVRLLPVPRTNSQGISTVVEAASSYLRLAVEMNTSEQRRHRGERQKFRDNVLDLFDDGDPHDSPSSDESPLKSALLRLDAEVLKLYDLPPRLERQLLELFAGVERKGVGCEFRGYYPSGFSSFLPLHMIISDSFQRAAADATLERFKPGESSYVSEVLDAAVGSEFD